MILSPIPDCLQSGHIENPPLFSGDFDNKGGFSRFVYPDFDNFWAKMEFTVSPESMELSRSNWISGIPSGKNLRKSMSSRANHELHFSPKIIKIVRRSSEIGGVKVHRCTGGGPLSRLRALTKKCIGLRLATHLFPSIPSRFQTA